MLINVQQDLHERLDRARYCDRVEGSSFQYGFNSTNLKKVASYWRHEFEWKKQVSVLNQYPHFKTKLEGTRSPQKMYVFQLGWQIITDVLPMFFQVLTLCPPREFS